MKKVASYLITYKWMILTIFLFVFLQALSQLFLPTLMGNIVDNGVVTGDIPYIWKVGMIMLGVAALGVFVSIAVSHFASKVAMGVGRDIRKDVFTHVSGFSLYEFDKIGTASLITRTTNDVNQIQQAMVMMLRMFLMAPFMLFGGLLMALTRDLKLSLVILVALPFIIIFVLVILKIGYPLFKAIQQKLDHVNLVFRENLTGIRVIRSFSKGKEERVRLRAANEDLTSVTIKVNRLMAFTMPFMMLLLNITIVFVIWFGAIRIDVGTMQIGDLMAYIQYVMLIMFSLIMTSMLFVILPRASVSANRIKDVLELEHLVIPEGDQTLAKNQGHLQFDDVTFYYPGANEAALKNISFSTKPGEVTAIIGGTGSGKTTLINLIPRFFEVSSGTIKVNGVDIKDTSAQEVRERVGLVPQKALLFSGTIRENMQFGKTDVTDEEMAHALSIAQAEDFIEQMPEKYDSHVEQGATNLSGGQKQRLSIARALVKKPDIYLFDDSFSALDYKTDAKLRAALAEETKHASMIVVAQRVSTVMNANQIIVLEKGRMVGIGTHDELLKSNDVYKEIVVSQLGEGEIA